MKEYTWPHHQQQAPFIPAITFVAASIIGLEPINMRSLRTIAKILGTVLCVTSAAAMTLVKGPKLLNSQLPSSNSLLSNLTESDNRWLLGCLCLFAGCCCWSFWLIIQFPFYCCLVRTQMANILSRIF